jgi:2-C-methyl-D-erythritol 4-phosphate cytidylyltransferase
VIPVVETLRHIVNVNCDNVAVNSVAVNGVAVNSITVPRNDYRLVQTPQTFTVSLLKKAYQQPYNDNFTDDASVVEAMGRSITLVEGNRENIKITTPFDLTVAEALFNA